MHRKWKMSSQDEFSSPLRIYHSTRDQNGERRHIHLYLPTALVEDMERFMRSNTTYLSLHQYMLNCLYYGQETLEKNGMATTSPYVKNLLDIEDLDAALDAQNKIVDHAQRMWVKAKTRDQRLQVETHIATAATNTPDPFIAQELRRIIGT
jgi:hypothetical protein